MCRDFRDPVTGRGDGTRRLRVLRPEQAGDGEVEERWAVLLEFAAEEQRYQR
jgi:hypothetical protein